MTNVTNVDYGKAGQRGGSTAYTAPSTGAVGTAYVARRGDAAVLAADYGDPRAHRGRGSVDPGADAFEEYYDSPVNAAGAAFRPEPAYGAPAAPDYADHADTVVSAGDSARGKHHRIDDEDVDAAGYAEPAPARSGAVAAGSAAAAGAPASPVDAGDTQLLGIRDDDYAGFAPAADAPAPQGQGAHDTDADWDEWDDWEESTDAAPAGGVPKRGVAMILIAVAVLLGLWGVYAMTQKNGADGENAAESADGASQGQEQVQAEQPQQPGAGGGSGDGAKAANAGSATNANAANSANTANGVKPANSAPQAGAGQVLAAGSETINVYNNSVVPNLAADVSGQLKGKGVKVGEVGNITEAQAILQQNTVFFNPATPGAEERARELATKVGGIAKANDATVPPEANKPDALTLVLTGPVAV